MDVEYYHLSRNVVTCLEMVQCNWLTSLSDEPAVSCLKVAIVMSVYTLRKAILLYNLLLQIL